MRCCLAVDIGASYGRHIVGWKENEALHTREVYRFENGVVRRANSLTWDIEWLFTEVKRGIKAAFSAFPKIESLSIDTWGVDYVLLTEDDRVVLPCYAYRDLRTKRVIPKVHMYFPPEELYRRTGTQFQPFNTIYQLYDDHMSGRLAKAADFLMIPEYLMYRLTGVKKKEYTNATTTGLISAETGRVDRHIVKQLGFSEEIFPRLYAPGTSLGGMKHDIVAEVGGNCEVILCATHDTASAVEGIPMVGNAPYISSGTWSLLGIKTARPILTESARTANFSNEGGVGYNRFQKNVMGLWLIQCLRRELCPDAKFSEIAQAAEKSSYMETVDVDIPDFLAPASMRIAMEMNLNRAGRPLPQEKADFFACAYRSIAKSYHISLERLKRITGEDFDRIYIAGGGAKSLILNRMTEKAIGMKVIALPIEATSLGNLRVQMERN